MDLERCYGSSLLASTPGDAAGDAEAVTTDRMEIEAAEILAALAHSKKQDAAAVAAEFAAKWGCKGKRVRRRVSRSSSSESPPSDVGLNPVDPVQLGSDLAEDRATVDQHQVQLAGTTVVIKSVEAEENAKPLKTSYTCTARYTSNGVVKLKQNVTEAEKETCRLYRMLSHKESDWEMIRERQILLGIVGMPEKDIWEDRKPDQMTGNDVFIKSVKEEQNAESATCASKYMSGGGGRSRQNLTEAEKEAKRLRRILANRESARQTIRRRQALCEQLTLKVADLTRENENLKRAKELALKEYKSQESANKDLKAQMAKAIKAEEKEATGEVKLSHQISGSSGNYPFFFYNNQHPFPPFCWPSIVQSSHTVQSQFGHQNSNVVPLSISPPTNGGFDSSHDHENSINVDGPKTPLYVVPYPWFFSLPDHGNGLHLQSSCGPKSIDEETTENNRSSSVCSLKSSVVHEEKFNLSLPVEVEKEAYCSFEASPNNLTQVRPPPDGDGQCRIYNIKEEVIMTTPLCSAGATYLEQENKTDYAAYSEVASVRSCHSVGALPEENPESTKYLNKNVTDAAAAAEARKRRKELTKLKNLNGRQCRTRR
ncbi:hypothetical protein COLO4_29783 [Corchorus olitorius]|uniref:BZIP domain-containing protein n=1 Tax=Corchorus olitorius TaxID=93759 RepID=A0A1R3HD66_9ROSI|nr:hypothetical protein COLO4_29783 [Corchorus olitorius]